MATKKLMFSVTIKDCEVQTFRCGGSGGQHQNKTETGVRVIHRPSGAVGEGREFKSQWQNKKAAFSRMGKSKEFTQWARLKVAELSGEKSIDERVDEQMEERNLKIEVRDETKRWREE